ncbi:NADPH oxidase organizer 1-like [Bufo gargarizans]|uniref:NADPH oxidase organizer 1-like n=1 Tax=Bufo gargarizans TaxID=30331 RepID=UPI001CF3DE6D|nr:NADPH oxidase organizer 1-like [Bufo gargarizans]
MKGRSSRHPVNVEAIGLMQHGDQKTYMFSVSWSDHNKLLVYRTFGDFRKFQRDLKKKFPLEAGALNKTERTLPKLKDAPRTVTKRSASKRFLERLRLLEDYSQALLRLDAKISQSDFVVQFFTLQPRDLNPSFPEDSLFIMPSEKKEETQIISSQTPDISAPLICPKYMCSADYETVDLKNRPFRVKQHEFLDVLLKDSTGWWLVESEGRQLAWFPAPYLQDQRNTEECHIAKECQGEGTLCVVVKAYEAQNSDELSVGIGVVVEVLRKSDSGWWLIRYNRRTGFIPSLYLKPYWNPCEKIQHILSRERYVSTPNLLEDNFLGDAYSFLALRPSFDDQRQSDRGRSLSLGATSLGSEARSDLDSDMDSVTGSSGRLNSSNSELSSLSISNSSLPATASLCGAPKIPARPKPDEILQKCSTVTKKRLQRSRGSVQAAEVTGTMS